MSNVKTTTGLIVGLAGLFFVGLVLTSVEAQQQPAPVSIWCQGTSGTFAPCAGGNALDYDTGGGTVNQGTVGIVLPGAGGPVAAGTSANPLFVTGSGAGGASVTDNTAFTYGTTAITPIGGVLDDTAPNAATENRAAITRITPQKAMHVNLRNQSGSEMGTASAPIRIDPTASTAQPVNQFTASDLNAQVVGAVAHDAADAGNPIKIGCQARTTNRTAVADADRADCVADKNGQIIVTNYAPRERVVRSGAVTLSTTTETTLVAAGGAGVFRDLTYLKCTNNSATLTRVDLRDATAGTVIDSWALAANGGGFNLAFTVPYAQATANNNWTVQLATAVADVRCSAQAVEKN